MNDNDPGQKDKMGVKMIIAIMIILVLVAVIGFSMFFLTG